MLTDSLTLGVIEFSDNITHIVFYACYKYRCHEDALRREGVVCRHHLIYRDVRRTHTKRICLIDMASDSHLAHHVCHRMRAILLHKICRDIVRTLGEPPLQRHCLSYPLVLIRTLWCPSGVIDEEGLRNIHNPVAWCHTLLHCKSVKEWLDGRTHLTLTLTHVVIFEIAIVRTSHISLDVSGVRLDSHERGTQMRLIIFNGVIRSHQRIDISVLVP